MNESEIHVILKHKVPAFPETLIILGSGWNNILEQVEIETEISYKESFGVETSVPGHEGKLVIGELSNELMSERVNENESSSTHEPINQSARIAFMVGRFHMYEGFTAREATLPIRVFAKAGLKNVIVTAACGALHEKYQVGDFVITSDLLTLLLALDNPLVGPEFVDMSQCFDATLRHQAIKICVENNIPFREGVYAYYHGPNFETPADKMALHHLGADVVGMSTVPETIMARSLGINVLSLSLVTNLAFVKHDHKEVLAQANKAGEQMVQLLVNLVSGIR